jgi:hypothetical protein
MLTTQEAQIRRMEVQSQPQTNTLRGPILKKKKTQKIGGGGRGKNDPNNVHTCE